MTKRRPPSTAADSTPVQLTTLLWVRGVLTAMDSQVVMADERGGNRWGRDPWAQHVARARAVGEAVVAAFRGAALTEQATAHRQVFEWGAVRVEVIEGSHPLPVPALLAQVLAESGLTPFADAGIRVWPFADAPLRLQVLSDHGGDEDWLAVVPPGVALDDVGWLGGSTFGTSISVLTWADGWRVVIGAH